MKNNFLLLLVCSCAYLLPASAKNYYVSAAGNNSSNGLSAATAWQSISKLNSSFSTMAAGDSILFRRGDVFYGAIVVGKSGTSSKPIVISAYGSGDKPVVTGFVTASSWIVVSNGVYQSHVPGAKNTLNMVSLNGVPQGLGRYPNATDSNGGYLKYESFSGSSSITDNELTGATNWTGAEAVIRKNLWVLDRCKITTHNGTLLSYTNTNSSTYAGSNNFGYFIQNDVRTLDRMGEWYFNKTTKNVQVYFGTNDPSSYTVKVSTLDTLLTMVSKSYISISNIVFEGANATALYASGGGYINIQSCDFINNGTGGMNIQGASNVLVENCNANYNLNNAITVYSSKVSNITIRGCAIKNTAAIPGMGLSNGNSYKAVVATALNNLLIEYNTVDTTGYVGIEFQGNNVSVRYNVVNYFDFIKDDAGGIYTYTGGTDASPGTIYNNRVVSNNIVMNGAGAPKGRSGATLYASGIYLDGRSMNVSVLNNTVFSNAKNGIHANNPAGVVIKGNTSYDNANAMSMMRYSWGSISNFTMKHNIFYPRTASQKCFYYTNGALNTPVATTLQSNVAALGNIDSNIYSMLNPLGFTYEIYGSDGGGLIQCSPQSLEGWQAFSAHDANGKKPVRVPAAYQVNDLSGSNKFLNGAFTSNISSITLYGANTTASWDNTGKIDGGSLKLSFSNPVANSFILLHSPVGAVSNSKQYVLRFSTYGTTQQGILRAYIRKTTSPYILLVPMQVKYFGSGRTDHEFLFTAPTEDAGSFVISVEQNSGTTYIDNISFQEATAAVYDPASQLRFEYNATRLAKTIFLDANYIGVDGQLYNGTVTLQPFTSVILVKDTTVITAGRTTNSRTIVAKNAVVKTATAGNGQPLKVSAYPNPSSNVVNLSIQGGSNSTLAVIVYNYDGKAVYQTTGSANKNYFFGSDFIPGMYIIKVIQDNIVQSLKIIKTAN